MWLVAMGERIVQDGAVPVGVPFATAESSGWPNVPVLGEIVFHAIYSLGVLALPFALILMDLAALAVLAVGAKDRGAAPVATSVALVIASLGMLPALGIVRSQFLSWVPFAVLLLLLRRQHERPDWHIWLVVPLLALWGNLHGGVLVGVVVTGAYLILSRLRTSPITAVGVGSACLAALFLTPGTHSLGHLLLRGVDQRGRRAQGRAMGSAQCVATLRPAARAWRALLSSSQWWPGDFPCGSGSFSEDSSSDRFSPPATVRGC